MGAAREMTWKGSFPSTAAAVPGQESVIQKDLKPAEDPFAWTNFCQD